MENEVLTINQINQMNPLVLAFVGDAVHTLFVRNYVVKSHTFSAGKMHKESAKFCNATAQSKVLDKLLPTLNEIENEIVNRARNAKNSHVAKHSNIVDYKKATSFEALVGYLHLTNQQQRLDEVLELSLLVE